MQVKIVLTLLNILLRVDTSAHNIGIVFYERNKEMIEPIELDSFEDFSKVTEKLEEVVAKSEEINTEIICQNASDLVGFRLKRPFKMYRRSKENDAE